MSDFPMLRMNLMAFSPLALAHELAVRKNELYEAMKVVEGCGASPELTEAIVRLGKRMQRLNDGLVDACKEALGNDG